jgi:hypothetical protein
VNQSRIRKEKYGVSKAGATVEENAGKYGSPDCPGAGETRSTSSRRSFGTIGARHEGITHFAGVSLFKSTEAGKLQETAARQKNPTLPKPERFTFRRPRAREGKDLQANA